MLTTDLAACVLMASSPSRSPGISLLHNSECADRASLAVSNMQRHAVEHKAGSELLEVHQSLERNYSLGEQLLLYSRIKAVQIRQPHEPRSFAPDFFCGGLGDVLISEQHSFRIGTTGW
jgi:hypothetical protein